MTTVTESSGVGYRREYFFSSLNRAKSAASFYLNTHDPDKVRVTGSVRSGEARVWKDGRAVASVEVAYLECVGVYKSIGDLIT